MLVSLPPVWGAPSPSPFAIKLELWLEMAEIPYVSRPLRGPPRSSTGKIPYVVTPDGRVLHDSGLIIETLGKERGIDLDEGLSPGDRAVGHAIRRMIEEHLYFVGLCDRWLSEEGFAATARDYFRHLPQPIRWILPRILRRQMRRYAHAQGVGRHPPEQRARLARADLAALAQIVGEGPFVFGRLSTIDATVAGFLWSFAANPFPSIVGDGLRAHPNLLAYLDRIKQRYGPSPG